MNNLVHEQIKRALDATLDVAMSLGGTALREAVARELRSNAHTLFGLAALLSACGGTIVSDRTRLTSAVASLESALRIARLLANARTAPLRLVRGA